LPKVLARAVPVSVATVKRLVCSFLSWRRSRREARQSLNCSSVMILVLTATR
jgi:hypothetical protein